MVDAPDWFRSLYGAVGAVNEWRQVNASINFPAVSDVILDRYELITGERLDGVIAMDPLALGRMTRGTGPIDAGALGKIGPHNAREVLLRDVYIEFQGRPDAQNRVLRSSSTISGIGRETWTSAVSLMDWVTRWTGKDLKIFATDPAIEDALVDLGIDGGYDDVTSNVQAVFNNNWSANKIDYYLHRTIETHIVFDSDGEATVTTTALLVNEAPPDVGGLMSGSHIKGQADGTNTMSLFFLMPEGSSDPKLTIDGRGPRGNPFHGRDDLSPVAWTIVRVPAGETARVTLTYTLAGGATDGVFPFTLFPQTTVNPDAFELTAEGPDGRLLEISEMR